MITCFDCGAPGHIARDCPNKAYLADTAGDGRPRWCGTCDPRTRHVDLGDHVRRCECHPESHKLPGHMRRCPHCHVVTVQWDTAECGRHHIAGQHPIPVTAEAHPVTLDLRAVAAMQAAASRASRGPILG